MKSTSSSTSSKASTNKKQSIKKKKVKKSIEISKLDQEYHHYFVAPAATPTKFQILTMYDYLTPANTTNHT